MTKVFSYSALKRYSNFIVYSMKKQFVKTVSTIMGQIIDINDIVMNITISFCEPEA